MFPVVQRPTIMIVGSGRHLAAVPHELPQVEMKRNPKTTSRFRNKNNTLVDHIKMTENTEFEDYDAVVTVLAYFSYLQNQATVDAGIIVGMNEFTSEFAYLNYSLCLSTKDAGPIAGQK